MNTRYGWFGAAAGASLLLAACGGKDSQPNPACPRVAIVADFARATYFRDGPGRDLTDVAAEGSLELRGSKCNFVTGAVDIDFDLAVIAASGPADRTRAYDLDYFVAVVDPERNVTRHESFRIRVQFDNAAQARQVVVEPISSRIPLPERARAPGYDVFVGFQLTDDQLIWNRRRRGG